MGQCQEPGLRQPVRGAGAVRVSGSPSGGVSGAGAAAADDVGSVIDFLSGAGFGRVAFLSQAGRAVGSDEQIYSTLVAATRPRRSEAVSWVCLATSCT